MKLLRNTAGTVWSELLVLQLDAAHSPVQTGQGILRALVHACGFMLSLEWTSIPHLHIH